MVMAAAMSRITTILLLVLIVCIIVQQVSCSDDKPGLGKLLEILKKAAAKKE
jgi:hypothetical protein